MTLLFSILLAKVCKRLCECTDTMAFWLCVAQCRKRNCPLPLPPFMSEALLTVNSLRHACIRGHAIQMRLRNKNILIRSYRQLATTGQRARVHLIACLPGGRFVLTAHVDGFVGLWNMDRAHHSALSPEVKQPEESAVSELELIASHTLAGPPITLDFMTSDDILLQEVTVTITGLEEECVLLISGLIDAVLSLTW